MADLRYNIESLILKGNIGNLEINVKAGSGGRAGSRAVTENIFLANNSYATNIGGEENEGTHNFGPIPRGVYTLKIHESRLNWIRLNPKPSNVMFGRKGFAIHGRGRVGSHGCIVPYDTEIIKKMIKALKANKSNSYTLEVISMGSNIGWQNSIG